MNLTEQAAVPEIGSLETCWTLSGLREKAHQPTIKLDQDSAGGHSQQETQASGVACSEEAVPATPAARGDACSSKTAVRPLYRSIYSRTDSAYLNRPQHSGGTSSGSSCDAGPPRGLALVPHLSQGGSGGAGPGPASPTALQPWLMAAEAAAAAAQEDAAHLRQQLEASAAAAVAAQRRAEAAEAGSARLGRQLAVAHRSAAAQAAAAQARLTAAEQRGREMAAALVAAEELRQAAEVGRLAAERAARGKDQRVAALLEQAERQRSVIATLAESRGVAFEERFSLRLEARKFSRELAQAQRATLHLQQALDQQRAAMEVACAVAAEQGERAATERWQGRVSTLRKQLSETRRKLQATAESEAAAREQLAAARELLEQAHTALSADHAVLRQASDELAAELATLRKCTPPAAAQAARLTLQRAASGCSCVSSSDIDGASCCDGSRPGSPATPGSPPTPGSLGASPSCHDAARCCSD